MKRRSLLIGTLMVVLVAAASIVGLTALSGNVGAAEEIEVGGPPPGGDGCICPANYDPVVCKAQDGSRHTFSNACVAGCSGFTKCVRFAVVEP